MCLLFFAYRITPGYRLVAAANRDEFLARSTAPLAFLDREQTILGGRDLQGGGTWLGISSGMRFAAITNYRDPAATRVDAPSRGEIILDYLTGRVDAREYLQGLKAKASRYNGFNVILGDATELYYYSNKITAPRLLSPGFYGLSNHLLDTPWPKVQRGKRLLFPHMVETDRVDSRLVFEILADGHRPPENQLPETGVGPAWERLLSSIFIDGSDYGTRSSAVITITDTGCSQFIEKTVQRPAKGGNRMEVVAFSLNC